VERSNRKGRGGKSLCCQPSEEASTSLNLLRTLKSTTVISREPPNETQERVTTKATRGKKCINVLVTAVPGGISKIFLSKEIRTVMGGVGRTGTSKD